MIRSVRGTLTAVGADGAVVEVGGVGLLVHVSTQTQGGLPPLGGLVALETHLIVREDALELFGFAGAAERELFVAFVGVSGVGPKSAIAICGLADPATLRRTIQTGDTTTLQRAAGVGKRTAERLVVELRDRLGPSATDAIATGGTAALTGPLHDAHAALAALGFGGDEITWALADGDADADTGELVRSALTRLRKS
jgi:Holliday junction DNA helicase RuvA